MPKYALRHCGWRCVASGREQCGLLGGEFVGSARLSTRFFLVSALIGSSGIGCAWTSAEAGPGPSVIKPSGSIVAACGDQVIPNVLYIPILRVTGSP
jgi:hypothetical protein